jgi:hypothetical protein
LTVNPTYDFRGQVAIVTGARSFVNGIVRIGRLDGDIDALDRQHQDFSATIERAE